MAVTWDGKVNGVPCGVRVFDKVIPVHDPQPEGYATVRITLDRPGCPLEDAGLADGAECIVEIEGEVEFVGRCIILHPDIKIAWVEGPLPPMEGRSPK
jgi:hypothetical protein